MDPALLNGGATDAMWTNLGDWSVARHYPDAATALAARVGAATRLGPGDSVVDYACGYGDSLRLWVERFGVAKVVGIEPDPAVVAVVQERIARWGVSDRVSVRTATAESTAPRAAAADVTAVVCVDAAYHFRTRAQWIARVAADLQPGARLGFSDLVCEDGADVPLSLRLAARAMHIPHANLVDFTALLRECIAHGLTPHEFVSAGHHVLDGFVAHAPRRGLPLRLTRQALQWFRRRRAIDYVIIGATI